MLAMRFIFSLIIATLLAACTDYVQKMDDGFDEWEQAQTQITTSSPSQTETSSSSVKSKNSSSSVILSGDSREKSSSSTKKNVSSSSNKNTSSNSIKSSSSSAKITSSFSTKSSSSSVKPISSSSGQKNNSSSSIKATSSSTKVTSSSSIKSSSSSVRPISSSSSKKNEISSSSENVKFSSGKASWAYLNPAISYGEMTDNRDGQVYKTVKIGEQTWMAENLNLEMVDSYCFNDSAMYCDKYGRLYTWAAAIEACPAGWHLPDSTECEKLFAAVGGINDAGIALKSTIDWMSSTYYGGKDTYGFSAHSAGYKNKEGEYGGLGEWANFWLSSEYDSEKARLMFFKYNVGSGLLGYTYKNELYSIRCLKNEIPHSSSSISSSSSSKASWAYLNPAISYGEITDDRDGQVYKTVVINSKTWMAENLNYESIKSYCYENKKDSCSKYGRLYTWSAAMDSVGAFSTNSKGCGYPNECNNSKNPVRGVCPEKWHLPSQQEWYNLSTYNSSTISGDLSSAGERLKSANGWFNSGNGNNTYGFSALPAGVGTEENYSSSGKKTCFWSSSDGNGIDAYGIHFEYSDNKARLQYTMKRVGCSIRCIKD